MQPEFFSHWTPMELHKGMSADGADEAATAVIGGVISDESVDQQGEMLLQGGVDWSYFMRKGWFNYEHNNGPEFILGHPTKLIRDNGQTRVEGVLYLDRPKAKAVIAAARDIQKATGGARSLGFSVEGQVLQRDPGHRGRILKAKVLNVAITAHPVNTGTNLELLKSLAKGCGILGGHEVEKGASVGHQAPASGGGVNAPLVPQNITPSVASLAPGAQSLGAAVLLSDVAKIKRMFPRIDDRRALELAKVFRARLR